MNAIKRNHGFTMIELMITLAVAAVLLGLAAPGFRDFIQNNRATTQANNLVSAINLARSEAVTKGVQFSICPSSDQSSCTGSDDWSVGWIVFRDADRTGTPTVPADDIVRVWGALPGNPTLDGPVDLRYRPQGGVASSGIFTLTVPDCTGEQKRTIDVNAVGRPNVTRSACS